MTASERIGPPLTARELSKAEAELRSAAETYEAARAFRNAVVRQALAERWTHAEIAEATGLTRGRIGQIAKVRNLRKPTTGDNHV